MEHNLNILTEKQREAWELREKGMTYKEMAAQMGISMSAARAHVIKAERRFREYERFIKMKENDNETEVLTLTHGEIKLLVDALMKYEQELLHEARHDIRTDWQGRILYDELLVITLSEKLQHMVYGEVRFKSILDNLLEKKESSD